MNKKEEKILEAFLENILNSKETDGDITEAVSSNLKKLLLKIN